jgi:glycosyltransferase involved in cell wall biosynthesis
MKPGDKICLITPSQLCSAPRVVKEADALAAAGYDVTVMSTRNSPVAEPLDEAILRKVVWKSRRVELRRGARPLRVLLQKSARMALSRMKMRSPMLGALAESEAFPGLLREALRERPRLYIGHCLTGLAAAWHAGRKRGVMIGFDAEDYHEAEMRPEQMGEAGVRVARALQAAAWPHLAHLTAASPLIARQLAEDYGREPAVVLNVFPKSMAPREPPEARPAGSRVRLYWFSQTIGPGRGLEEATEACSLLRTPVELHLRGHDGNNFAAQLRKRLRGAGAGHELMVHDLATPDEMARLAARCDIGLCLEQTVPFNRGICLTNKVFTYLLAGIPMVLSATPAHAELAPRLGNAAVLAEGNDPAALARAIAALAEDPERRRAAAEHAWHLGQSRYNWDVEQEEITRRVAALHAPEARNRGE